MAALDFVSAPWVRKRFRAGDREVQIERDAVRVDGVIARLTHPTKVLWPENGYTKLDLAAYYLAASPFILPYLAGRPLVLETFQQGIDGPPLFIQKRPQGTPDWVGEACVAARDGRRLCHVKLDDGANGLATLAWLANRNCIPLHAWLATESQAEKPDWLAFDLDPAEGATFAQVVVIARWLHERLSALSVRSFVKVSGSRGLHVLVPIVPEWPHDEVRSFATAVAEEAVAALPADATLLWSVSERRGKVFVDVRRNTYGHTLVAPYSVRAKPGAPVSVALEWPELEDSDLIPTRWGMGDALARLAANGDPLAPAYHVRQSLPATPRA